MARMTTANKLLLGLLGGSASDPAASFTVTTTGAQTLTINGLTVSASTTVDWGDGLQDTYTGGGTRTHNYAGAGTWTVRILQPLNVTALTLNTTGVPIVFNSANVKNMANMVTLQVNGLPAGSLGTFNFSDVAAWRPTSFFMYSLPTGYAGTFNSADVTAWRPADFYLHSMPTGYACTFNSADVAAWNPGQFYLHTMPAATSSFTLTAANFNGWTGTSAFRMLGNALTQAQVDAILLGLYVAAQSRTVTGGSMILSGSNAAPSGTYAAECPPTSGKAAAYELINDTCGTIAAGKEWASITVTGGLP